MGEEKKRKRQNLSQRLRSYVQTTSDKSFRHNVILTQYLRTVLTCKQYCNMRQGPMATLSPSNAPITAWIT